MAASHVQFSLQDDLMHFDERYFLVINPINSKIVDVALFQNIRQSVCLMLTIIAQAYRNPQCRVADPNRFQENPDPTLEN